MYKHKDKYQILGLNVAYYRKLRGFTQTQLADKLFVTRHHLSRIESPNAVKSFSIDLIFEIADILEIDMAMLFENKKQSNS